MAEFITAPTVKVEEASTSASNRRSIFLIAVSVAFFWTSLYLYVPTLPLYAQTRTNDLAVVGVILSMYGLWQGLLRLPMGIAADWLGRRKMFIFLGFGFSILGAWLMGTAVNANGILVGRAVTGLAAASWVPLIVLFTSQFAPREAVRATAILSVVNSLGCMLGSSLNGTLVRLGGYQLAFFLAMGVGVVGLLIMLPVREVRLPVRKPSVRGIGALITRRDVLLPSFLSATFHYIGWATTFGFLPILARNLGATGEMNSLLVTTNLALTMAGSSLTTAIVRRTGNIRLIYLSFVIIASGIGVAVFAASIPIVILAQILIGLGNGMGYPLFMGMSIEKVDGAERATAMGLHQAVYAIGMFAGPWLSGILANALGIQPMFAVTGAGALVLGFGLARALSQNK